MPTSTVRSLQQLRENEAMTEKVLLQVLLKAFPGSWYTAQKIEWRGRMWVFLIHTVPRTGERALNCNMIGGPKSD